MKIGSRKLDHLVYCVTNLDETVQQLYDEIGVQAVIGGRHLNHGTKNALINLGDKAYLELLAIDTENKHHSGSRWMGIDLISEPKITRWAIHSDNLHRDSEILKQYNEQMGDIIGGEREKENGEVLRWEMIKPLSSPEVDILPFMIDWSASESHPTDGKVETCSLEALHFYDQVGQKKLATMLEIFGEMQIQTAQEIAIKATIKGPLGSLTI